jgi:hypothetical protein|tara:strand:+ start:790 stop:1152 length:363 start_codon:yes stop_codon:yes gene_type:complete
LKRFLQLSAMRHIPIALKDDKMQSYSAVSPDKPEALQHRLAVLAELGSEWAYVFQLQADEYSQYCSRVAPSSKSPGTKRAIRSIPAEPRKEELTRIISTLSDIAALTYKWRCGNRRFINA